MYREVTALEKLERYDRPSGPLPVKTGEPWSEDDDRRLFAAFDADRACWELAAADERTVGKVRVQL